MAFVNETIPEEQKSKFKFPVKTRPDGSKPTLWKWTIDRDRDVFLVCVDVEGGGYEGTPVTKHFVMSLKGELISLSADPLNCIRNEAEGVVMPWRLHKLVLPPAFSERKDEAFELIRQAFRTMGNLYDGDKYADVSIDFSLSSSR